MSLIVKEILRSISESNINGIDILTTNQFHDVLEDVCTKYSGGIYRYPLWECLIDRKSIMDSQGWQQICDLVGQNKCLIFLEKNEGQFLASIKDGETLNKLLRNTFGFVFYITDSERTFLLCFNDHYYLIGCGLAKEWI